MFHRSAHLLLGLIHWTVVTSFPTLAHHGPCTGLAGHRAPAQAPRIPKGHLSDAAGHHPILAHAAPVGPMSHPTPPAVFPEWFTFRETLTPAAGHAGTSRPHPPHSLTAIPQTANVTVRGRPAQTPRPPALGDLLSPGNGDRPSTSPQMPLHFPVTAFIILGLYPVISSSDSSGRLKNVFAYIPPGSQEAGQRGRKELLSDCKTVRAYLLHWTAGWPS